MEQDVISCGNVGFAVSFAHLHQHRRNKLKEMEWQLSLARDAAVLTVQPIAPPSWPRRHCVAVGCYHFSICNEQRSNLSRKWKIGIDTAKKTLQITTRQRKPYKSRRSVLVSVQLFLNRQCLNGNWFSNTLFSKVKSFQGTNACAQVLTNGQFTTVHHPMDSKSQVAHALTGFADDIGIPDS